jgi:hypothetical protein
VIQEQLSQPGEPEVVGELTKLVFAEIELPEVGQALRKLETGELIASKSQ